MWCWLQRSSRRRTVQFVEPTQPQPRLALDYLTYMLRSYECRAKVLRAADLTAVTSLLDNTQVAETLQFATVPCVLVLRCQFEWTCISKSTILQQESIALWVVIRVKHTMSCTLVRL